MAEIDQVSIKIGALEACSKATSKTLSEHKKESEDRHKEAMKKLDEIVRLQMLTNGRVTANEREIEDIIKPDGILLSAYKNGMDWRETKLKAMGVMFGISVAGGSIGAKLTSIGTWIKFWQ